MLYFKSTYITYFVSGDELTISSSFKDGNVLFSWNNLNKTYYDILTSIQANWTRVHEPQYIVKNALMYDSISVTVRAEGSSIDYKSTNNGEFNACCLLS